MAPSAASVVLGRERVASHSTGVDGGELLVVADPEPSDTAPLPSARDEARRAEAAFQARVEVLESLAATINDVVDRLPAAWVVHLACHGTNNILRPKGMRLLLSGGDLTLDRLLALPELRARLVVLSTCQTGQVDTQQASNEMLGIPLAFLQAGACAVVSALWPVDDQVTAMLMGRFYEELVSEFGADGWGGVAWVLTRAQRWLRSLPSAAVRRGPGGRFVVYPNDPLGGRSAPGRRRGRERTVRSWIHYFWAGFVTYGR